MLKKPFILAAAVLLSACAQPLPQDKRDYAGTWQNDDSSVRLTISADGGITFNGPVTINGTCDISDTLSVDADIDSIVRFEVDDADFLFFGPTRLALGFLPGAVKVRPCGEVEQVFKG